MFCNNCGNQISENSNFCGKCGCQVEKPEAEPVKAEPAPKKRSGKKKKIIIWSIVAALLVYYVIFFGVPLIVNSPAKLQAKLENTTWYTAPASFVATGTGVEFDSAYRIEFSEDTAVITTYSCYGEKGDYTRVEIIDQKTVSWNVDDGGTLVLGQTEYEFRFFKQSESQGRWYFEDGKLVAGKTYYPKDKWGYSEFE